MVPLVIGLALAGTPDEDSIAEVLDALHRSAAEADGATYWALYADDAVFVGTDPDERWTLDEFKTFAEPHFETAPAWAYTPHQREIHVGPKRRVAWFYETVDHARYGRVRGSGAVRREKGAWRITQYVLSFPVPNTTAADVLKITQGEPAPSLPTPFTAAAIRGRYQLGFTTLHRHTTTDGVSLQEVAVVEAGQEGARLRFSSFDAEGRLVSPAVVRGVNWVELRDHAAFPAAQTTWTDEVVVDVPAGRFSTREYRVERGEGETHIFWFDLSRPGPPVKMQVLRGQEIVSTMVELEAVQ